uniref:SCP domain-containing protein n=1 Tax=Strongyloides venezuelensis TaxID=75913 RepID=A0A0K0G209_STRVS
MFFKHLLDYIIFIILFSKVDVLLGILRKSASFSEPNLRASQIFHAQNRIIRRGGSVRWGEDRVKIFDFNDPANKVGRKNSRGQSSNKKQTYCPTPNLILLEKFIDRYSLNGKIWHHIWKHSLLHSCIASNRFETLQKNFLTEINLYRKVHGSPPVYLDQNLSKKALLAAMNSAARGRWVYSEFNDIRINFATINIGLSPVLINQWYKESKKYNYKTKDWMSNSVHFSNLIWRHTTRIGIGIAQKSSDLYICLRFSPEGNQKNQFRDNVGKAKYHLVNYKSLFRE